MQPEILKKILPLIELKKPPDPGSPTSTETSDTGLIKPRILKCVQVSLKPQPKSSSAKRNDVALRKQLDKTTRTSIVKSKLSSFTRKDPNFNYLEAINIAVRTINEIAFGAYHLINIYLLDLLENNKVLPQTLEQNFFYKACCHVSQVKGSWSPCKDTDPWLVAVQKYRSTLPEEYSPPQRDKCCNLINNLNREMITVMANHFNLNFDQRFSKFLRAKYNIDDRWRHQYIIDRIFRRIEGITVNKFAGNAITEGIIEKYQSRFQNPGPNTQIFQHLDVYLPMFMEFMNQQRLLRLQMSGQRESETQDKTLRSGGKGFTLCPLKGSLIPSHIKICTVSLADLVSQWSGKPVIKGREDQEALWRKIFRVSQFETKNRKFRNMISTNGYEVVIHMRAPLACAHPERETLIAKKSQKNLGRKYQKCRDCKVFLGFLESEEENAVEKPIDPSPMDRDPNLKQDLRNVRLVGLDPGMKSLFTTCDEEGQKLSCSNKKYRHLTGQKKYVNKVNARKDRLKSLRDYHGVSFRSCDLEHYLGSLKKTWVLKRNADQEYYKGFYRKMKFKMYIKKQKVFRKLGNMLKTGETPNSKRKNQKPIIGFGSGIVNGGCIRGNRLPVKGFKNYLKTQFRNHVRVIDVDEFKTTKMCSVCRSETGEVKRWGVAKRGKGRGKGRGKEGEEIYLQGIWGLRRCKNNECRITWDRDVNASRNILILLKMSLMGKERASYLSRNPGKQSVKPRGHADSAGSKSSSVAEEQVLVPMSTILKDIGLSCITRGKGNLGRS